MSVLDRRGVCIKEGSMRETSICIREKRCVQYIRERCLYLRKVSERERDIFVLERGVCIAEKCLSERYLY